MTEWLETLRNSGAIFDDNQQVVHFRAAQAEQTAALHGTVLCALSGLACIEAAGADTVTFLQGQLTNDVKQVSAQHSQLAAWCSVKGRALAVFRVLQRENVHYLLAPQDRLETVLKRLTMYILRSQVKLRDVSQKLLCIGVGGVHAAAALEQLLGYAPPAEVDAAMTQAGVTLLRVAGVQPRFMLLAAPASVAQLWAALKAVPEVTPAGVAAWDLQDILAGLPQVFAQTAEAFLPQMLNLQAINGISFKKGCYTGQEIVARTQYLGKLKRRLFIAQLAQDECPAPGTALFAASGEQSVGQVVNASPHPDGGCVCTAVIQIASTEQPLHLGSAAGSLVELLPLPYALA